MTLTGFFCSSRVFATTDPTCPVTPATTNMCSSSAWLYAVDSERGGCARAAPLATFSLCAHVGARHPDEEPPLHDGHGVVEEERESRQHQDPGEYGIDVEAPLRLQNEVTDASRGPEILAHDRADEGHPHRSVQAGKDPTGGGRQVHVAHELTRRCSQHPHAGEDRRAHLAHSLVHVEEDDEEDERHPERHL